MYPFAVDSQNQLISICPVTAVCDRKLRNTIQWKMHDATDVPENSQMFIKVLSKMIELYQLMSYVFRTNQTIAISSDFPCPYCLWAWLNKTTHSSWVFCAMTRCGKNFSTFLYVSAATDGTNRQDKSWNMTTL